MSRFNEQMAIGGAGLMDQLGDVIEYWPGGDEDSAVEIVAVFTGQTSREEDAGRFRDGGHKGELMVWADAEIGVAAPNLKSDIAVVNGASWRVMEILETVGGMHRLQVERVTRNVVGRGRGRG
jgi:hypothetical protein